MNELNFLTRDNAEYIEDLYERFRENPDSIPETWRYFFAGFEVGLGRPLRGEGTVVGDFTALSQRRSDGTGGLVHSYRAFGHFNAKLDPLGSHRPGHPLLSLSEYGFSSTDDLDRNVGAGGFMGQTDGTLRDLIAKLEQTYCGTLGVEFQDISDKDQRAWLLDRMEPGFNRPDLTSEEKKSVLQNLIHAEEFEQFLHTKYIGQKRFSVEGGEAVIPLLEVLAAEGARLGVEQIVMGMAHRGRLNVLAHILGKPYELICSEFEGVIPKDDNQGDGDVKYHKGYSNDREFSDGKTVHLSLSPNPSHLEMVDPIVEGVVRAKQHHIKDKDQRKVVPILIHGEAAFAGQGIVPETLNLSELEGYRTGGTIHIIVNNQLGFTATASQTRFTPYPTDVAKMIQAPIFHVNGEDPEAVAHAAKLAMAFRQQFKVDVMLDIWCYRRFGHNETDDPTFTQPLMYEKIAGKRTVGELYAAKLVSENVIDDDGVAAMRSEVRGRLETALAIAREKRPNVDGFSFRGTWAGMTRAGEDWNIPTAVSKEVIAQIAATTTQVPEGFAAHRKLLRLLESRAEMAAGKRGADWGCAESWALGSILMEGNPVRLTGQDCERGTFSHRHAVWHDTQNGEVYIPLQHLNEGTGDFTIINTMLSEFAVLGFEVGYSMADPHNLVIWEAQFGDFVNGAQPIIDQFISSSESKWQRMSGIVLLLPHGYEGQGPEHSSARLERFLQGCADENMQVCYPTTPAQYFHLLRRQMRRKFRKPLVLMMPKSLLRDERASSMVDEFTNGEFRHVIADETVEAANVKRILLCSGKVFYTLNQNRADHGATDAAIVRVEQLYPFPKKQLEAVLSLYPNARQALWVQEEPKNMGAWTFVEPRLRPLLGQGVALEYRGRREASSPANGVYARHLREEQEILVSALGPKQEKTGV